MSTQSKAIFQRACTDDKLTWSTELEKLAIGYLKMLDIILSTPDPLTAYECAAIASGLAHFAVNVGWISHHSYQALVANAKHVRAQAMGKWAGQTVFVKAGAVAAPATTH